MRSAAKEKARAAWLQVGDAARLEIRHTAWWRHIRCDYCRYQATGDPALRIIFLSQGFWASSVYRICRAAVHGARPRILRALLAPLAAIAQKAVEIVCGISIPADCEIGEGLYIGHFGTIVFAPGTRMGHNCSVAQNASIGTSGGGQERGAPTIGNRVFIGAHSVIVGRTTIGDDAMIGAGSVVTRPVPARAVVIGNPARVISYDGSFDYVLYNGMDADPARCASLDKLQL
jgi:serine O-acetyltransferase